MACNLFHLDKWVLFRKLRQIWKSFFSFHACFDRMKFLLFYSLHMIAISVRSWRRRKLFSVSKKLIGQLGSLWGQACLRTAWSPLSDVFLISSSRDFLDLLLSDIFLVSTLQISPFLSFSASLSQMCAEFNFANFWRTQYLLLLRILEISARQT